MSSKRRLIDTDGALSTAAGITAFILAKRHVLPSRYARATKLVRTGTTAPVFLSANGVAGASVNIFDVGHTSVKADVSAARIMLSTTRTTNGIGLRGCWNTFVVFHLLAPPRVKKKQYAARLVYPTAAVWWEKGGLDYQSALVLPGSLPYWFDEFLAVDSFERDAYVYQTDYAPQSEPKRSGATLDDGFTLFRQSDGRAASCNVDQKVEWYTAHRRLVGTVSARGFTTTWMAGFLAYKRALKRVAYMVYVDTEESAAYKASVDQAVLQAAGSTGALREHAVAMVGADKAATRAALEAFDMGKVDSEGVEIVGEWFDAGIEPVALDYIGAWEQLQNLPSVVAARTSIGDEDSFYSALMQPFDTEAKMALLPVVFDGGTYSSLYPHAKHVVFGEEGGTQYIEVTVSVHKDASEVGAELSALSPSFRVSFWLPTGVIRGVEALFLAAPIVRRIGSSSYLELFSASIFPRVPVQALNFNLDSTTGVIDAYLTAYRETPGGTAFQSVRTPYGSVGDPRPEGDSGRVWLLPTAFDAKSGIALFVAATPANSPLPYTPVDDLAGEWVEKGPPAVVYAVLKTDNNYSDELITRIPNAAALKAARDAAHAEAVAHFAASGADGAYNNLLATAVLAADNYNTALAQHIGGEETRISDELSIIGAYEIFGPFDPALFEVSGLTPSAWDSVSTAPSGTIKEPRAAYAEDMPVEWNAPPRESFIPRFQTACAGRYKYAVGCLFLANRTPTSPFSYVLRPTSSAVTSVKHAAVFVVNGVLVRATPPRDTIPASTGIPQVLVSVHSAEDHDLVFCVLDTEYSVYKFYDGLPTPELLIRGNCGYALRRTGVTSVVRAEYEPFVSTKTVKSSPVSVLIKPADTEEDPYTVTVTAYRLVSAAADSTLVFYLAEKNGQLDTKLSTLLNDTTYGYTVGVEPGSFQIMQQYSQPASVAQASVSSASGVEVVRDYSSQLGRPYVAEDLIPARYTYAYAIVGDTPATVDVGIPDAGSTEPPAVEDEAIPAETYVPPPVTATPIETPPTAPAGGYTGSDTPPMDTGLTPTPTNPAATNLHDASPALTGDLLSDANGIMQWALDNYQVFVRAWSYGDEYVRFRIERFNGVFADVPDYYLTFATASEANQWIADNPNGTDAVATAIRCSIIRNAWDAGFLYKLFSSAAWARRGSERTLLAIVFSWYAALNVDPAFAPCVEGVELDQSPDFAEFSPSYYWAFLEAVVEAMSGRYYAEYRAAGRQITLFEMGVLFGEAFSSRVVSFNANTALNWLYQSWGLGATTAPMWLDFYAGIAAVFPASSQASAQITLGTDGYYYMQDELIAAKKPAVPPTAVSVSYTVHGVPYVSNTIPPEDVDAQNVVITLGGRA